MNLRRLHFLGADQSDLTFAREEATCVSNVYGVGPTLEGDLTKETVLRALKKNSIVHLATHSVFDDANPMSSAVILSGPDPCLRAHDILASNIAARTVVLSACSTARGGYRVGEGLVGLSYAFLRAGAESVVSSLWPVNDSTTNQLMGAFHQNLLVDGPVRALRKAMICLHEQKLTPYHWSAFVVLGHG